MKIVSSLAHSMAVGINKRVQRTSVAVLEYALKDALHYLIFYLIVIIIGGFTGHLVDALIAPIAFSILRRYSGGLHLSTDTRCTLFSAVMVFISIYMPLYHWYNELIVNSIAFVLVMMFAPSGSLAPQQYHRRFKIIACIFVLLGFFHIAALLPKVFLVQAVTTIPFMQRVVDRYKL
ncbi:accessory gene regulator B family protein [Gorillibacterium sp. sgz5001074]|uniref:accessory gene regulator B family protein n=1 Tax=Gorillibacterium sp. sgz5001074 TaxID=3446695 RepID=UPI003F66BC42